MNEPKHKCYYDIDGHFQPCLGMNILLDRDKNIEVQLMINMVKLKEYDGYVGIKKNTKHNGLVFNVCPLCGEHILNVEDNLRTNKIPIWEKQKE